jgi:hypothetical protein
VTEFRLHPRLLPGRAQALFEEYATRLYVQRDVTIDELAASASTETRGRVFAATGPPRVTRDELETLRARVLETARENGYPKLFPSRDERARFDAAVARIYVSEARLFPAEAAIRSVWAHHALVLLPDVTFWRWAPRDDAFGRVPNMDRYLPGRIDRHAYARLWWRATLALTRAGETERAWALLEGMPEAELDWVFTRHTAFGGSPEAVRAILEIWASRTRRSPIADNLVPRRAVLKAWLMAILRRGAFVSYDVLEPSALTHAFEEILDLTLASSTPAEPRRDGVLVQVPAIIREPVDAQAVGGAAAHEGLIAAVFARALPKDEPVVISVTDDLAIQGAKDNGSVLVEFVDPRGLPPDLPDPERRQRLLDLGFSSEPLGFARRIELTGDDTPRVVGAVVARALSEAFAVPSTTILRLD